MKKRIAWLLLGILFYTPVSFGGEPIKSSRQGFLLGFDVGGGALHFGRGRNMGSFMSGIKIGGGLNEKWLLMAEFFSSTGFKSGNPNISGTYFATQYFPTENFYIRPGLGIAMAEEDLPGNRTQRSDAGLAVGIATGYEFRLGKKFTLSPEAKFGYNRIEGVNHLAYGGAIDFRWYF